MTIESIEKRIETLVSEQFEKMTLSKSKRDSNRVRLSNRCQSIVYNEWGFSNQKVWDLIDLNVERLIPMELD